MKHVLLLKTLLLCVLLALIGGGKMLAQETIYEETFGSTDSKSVKVSSYEGWSATASMFTNNAVKSNYTGNENTSISRSSSSTISKDYNGVSGGSHCYNTASSSSTDKILTISNINISSCSGLSISFGYRRDGVSSNS